ncbi:hypothetical protein AAVH_20246 [Aphelenchoides avenae]|nr:hypothetical protein AAVH_20246 [Aphelenchus avenae]
MNELHILAIAAVLCAFFVENAHLNFSVPVGICPTGWTYGPSSNKCYKVVTTNQAGTKLSWNQALCFCDELDATLANVPNAFVEKELQSLAAGGEYHIGLRFDHGAKKWL